MSTLDEQIRAAGPLCATCQDAEQPDGHAPWPCLTVQAIAGHLGITQEPDHA